MAMAPWHERTQLLYAVLEKATSVLRAPIDRIEVTPLEVRFRARTKVLFWAMTKRLTISYRYVASSSPGASPQLLLDGKETCTFTAVPRADRTALQPWDERRELLNATISKATSVLRAPIDRIEVNSDKVLLRAGSEELAISYQYVKNPRGSLNLMGFCSTARTTGNVSSLDWRLHQSRMRLSRHLGYR
jgi:hypothetical protein